MSAAVEAFVVAEAVELVVVVDKVVVAAAAEDGRPDRYVSFLYMPCQIDVNELCVVSDDLPA